MRLQEFVAFVGKFRLFADLLIGQRDFFLFTSTETGRAAVLYRRRDGTLGMIEAAG